MTGMTKLLVSVRDAGEAVEALCGGAAVIDVKEPRLGSLGAASPETRGAVQRALQLPDSTYHEARAGECPAVLLSAALGELLEEREPAAAWSLDGYAYAKVGLAGCEQSPGWEDRWRQWAADLPLGTAPVAVVYADYRAAAAPDPWRILELAAQSLTQTLLIDTHNKSAGNVLTQWTACELAEIIAAAHDAGVQVALAGSITLECLDQALRFGPDWIAVRGGVCRSGRESLLDRQLVKRFADRLSTPGEADGLIPGNHTIDSPAQRP